MFSKLNLKYRSLFFFALKQCIFIMVQLWRSGAFLIAQLLKNPPAIQETPVQFLGREDLLGKGQAPDSSILGLLQWLSWWRICLQCEGPGFDPWIGRITCRRDRLQDSGLENSMDCIVTGSTKAQTGLSDFHFHFWRSRSKMGWPDFVPFVVSRADSLSLSFPASRACFLAPGPTSLWPLLWPTFWIDCFFTFTFPFESL